MGPTGARLIREYGLTVSERDSLGFFQQYACALCRKYYGNYMHTDHCHQTGLVRGLLCAACNTALGLFKENLQTIGRIPDYLANPPAKQCGIHAACQNSFK